MRQPEPEPQRDWTPRAHGDVYCSPSCGFKCKRAAFEKATADAASLAQRLGTGWKPSVWENCGWCYCAVKGVCRVHFNRHSGSYTAFFNGVQQFLGTSTDPVDAVHIAIKAAEERARLIRLDVYQFQDA